MLQRNRLQAVKEISYPAPPWQMQGQMWMGLFKTDQPIQLPAELHSLLDPRLLLVVLVRYLEGTLCYDELVFGTLARFGARVGVYVDYIWVTDLASVWGGRKIWGLPKNLAQFSWQDSMVSVTDEHGLIATIQVDQPATTLPWLWMPTPGLGQLDTGAWVFTLGSLWGRFGGAKMQFTDWRPGSGISQITNPCLVLLPGLFVCMYLLQR